MPSGKVLFMEPTIVALRASQFKIVHHFLILGLGSAAQLIASFLLKIFTHQTC